VESIPFTETRDYVQAIVRNESIYRELNPGHEVSGGTLPQQASTVAPQKTTETQQ
jgi:hypothetical protein